MKRLPWFRMYHEARNDAKLRTLSDRNFRIWFNLLCLAAEQGDRGEIPADKYPGDLLAIEVAGGDEMLLNEALHSLARMRIITRDDDAITFVHFMERQYDKPSDMPERTRERKRKERDAGVTAEVVTPLSRDVTPSHAQEEIRIEKTRQEEKEPTVDAPQAPPATEQKRMVVVLSETEGYAPDARLTKAEWGRFGTAAKELLTLGATTDEVRLRAGRYKRAHPDWEYTANALVNHWGKLTSDAPPSGKANGRASPADRQERTRGNLVEWFVESEGIGEQVDLRQANGAVGEPLRARTHQGPH